MWWLLVPRKAQKYIIIAMVNAAFRRSSLSKRQRILNTLCFAAAQVVTIIRS